ncbi:hypothetical protein VST7929_01091 [Vibrio stylophorae]|uniref:DUF1456 family protein n=1 Tax=Vibrio stylophorae TaxID=659351 RepID=A0ABN8DT84_9VIBR|nr:DUF1456 family protein [Vibrio stylophorae]CAH0533227.1 hypothetical protein VST7929_01091 [Vibrio stylophorae]
MTNNDIFRRVRDAFDFNENTIIETFSLADLIVTHEQVTHWLLGKREDDFITLSDIELATFLNGLINLKRGKREGEQAKPESNLNNNMVLQKLRIALNLKAEETLEILQLADVQLSKHELSAFFRKPDNKHYRACKDQLLQQFLVGVKRHLRQNSSELEA